MEISLKSNGIWYRINEILQPAFSKILCRERREAESLFDVIESNLIEFASIFAVDDIFTMETFIFRHFIIYLEISICSTF